MHQGAFHTGVARQCRMERSLRQQLSELAGRSGIMLVHEQKRWSSATFVGARHKLTWAFDGADDVARGERLIELLPEHEFDVAGHLVADATVTAVDHRADPPRLVVDMELLLLEEG